MFGKKFECIYRDNGYGGLVDQHFRLSQKVIDFICQSKHWKCRKTKVFRCIGPLLDKPKEYKIWAYWCKHNKKGWSSKPCSHLRKSPHPKEEVIEWLNKYHYMCDIARHVGLSRERVRQLINLYKLPYDKKTAMNPNPIRIKRNKEIIRLYQLGEEKASLIKKFNISERLLSTILIPIRKKIRAKIKDDICELYKKGYKQVEIACIYETIPSVICNILNKRGIRKKT